MNEQQRNTMKEFREWMTFVGTLILIPLAGLCWWNIRANQDLATANLKIYITDNFVSKPTFQAQVESIQSTESKQAHDIQAANEAATAVAAVAAKSQAETNVKLQHLEDLLIYYSGKQIPDRPDSK